MTSRPACRTTGGQGGSGDTMTAPRQGGTMKKLALVLLGLFLAAMAVTVFVHSDPVTMLVGVAFAIWSGVVFRKVWRMRATTTDAGKSRPWEN